MKPKKLVFTSDKESEEMIKNIGFVLGFLKAHKRNDLVKVVSRLVQDNINLFGKVQELTNDEEG
jgi:hypothetical protein